MDGAQVIGALVGLAIGLVIATLISAIILRAAISLFNRMSTDRVPEPSFGKAMLIVFVAMLVNMILSFLLTAVLGIGGAATNADQQSMGLVVNLISLPLSLLVMAFMVSSMLPTTFGKGFLISLLYLLVAIIVGIVIAIVVFGVVMLAGLAR